MSDHTYVGGELELFAKARHWKSYWVSHLRPHLRGSVLEVGAGIGANTFLLRNGLETHWLCLEPDRKLAAQLKQNVSTLPGLINAEVRAGTLASSVSPSETFDTILYIDVLEHIEADRGELEQAAEHLAPGGHLIALSPAHSWLYSAFDQAIGHCRRYNRSGIEALTPAGLRVAKSLYLDSVGLLASAANRWLLRQSMPNARQIHYWDQWMVPWSQVLDPLTGYRIGKSVMCIWERGG